MCGCPGHRPIAAKDNPVFAEAFQGEIKNGLIECQIERCRLGFYPPEKSRHFAKDIWVFRHRTEFLHPGRVEWFVIEGYSSEMIDDDFEIGNAGCDAGSFFEGVAANEDIDGFSTEGGFLEIPVEFFGESFFGSPRNAIAKVAVILAEFFKKRLEFFGANHLGKVPDNSAIERFVVRSDIEIPLVVGQVLPGLHDDDAIHSVFPGDDLVILRHERSVEKFIVFRYPVDALGSVEVPEVNVGVDQLCFVSLAIGNPD